MIVGLSYEQAELLHIKEVMGALHLLFVVIKYQ